MYASFDKLYGRQEMMLENLSGRRMVMLLVLVFGLGMVATACSNGGGGSPTAPAPSSGFGGSSFSGDAATDDTDGDTTPDAFDNCPFYDDLGDMLPDDQTDTDGDGVGDLCDDDLGLDDQDGDGILNDGTDNCPAIPNADQADADGDLLGDACDTDNDNDGVTNDVDNCEFVANGDQADLDVDGIGDACDDDADNDGVPNDGTDICPLTTFTDAGAMFGEPGAVDADGCSVADLCPCDEAGSHGQYVSCVTQAAKDLSKAGVITNQDHSVYVTEAAQSICGK